MKLAKITLAMTGIALVAVSGLANAGKTDPPNSSKSEEGAIVLAEAFLSLTAGAITRKQSCDALGGIYNFNMEVDANGNGQGTYDDNIVLAVAPKTDPNNGAIGIQFVVLQVNTGTLQDIGVSNWRADFAFGIKGAVMTGAVSSELTHFGTTDPWEGTIVKGFWAVERTFGRYTRGEGLEAITKVGYPRSKWRQSSNHERPNSDQGTWKSAKSLVTQFNIAACQLILDGVFSSFFGHLSFNGTIRVVGDF